MLKQISVGKSPAADLAGTYPWSPEPQVLALIALIGGIYAWRFTVVRSEGVRVSGWRGASFAAGLAVLTLALISPLDYLGEHRLFSMHMVQHLLLVDVAAILLLGGLNRALLRPASRRMQPIERALGRLAHPLAALLLLVAVMWIWHLPAIYELALDHAWAHSLEHATFLGAGIAFWWYLIEPVPPRQRLSGPGSIFYLGGAKLLVGAVGVALAFATSVIYPSYAGAPRTWGLTPIEDLNIGGIIMMIEQSIVLAIFFSIMFIRMLDRSEREQRRREQVSEREQRRREQLELRA